MKRTTKQKPMLYDPKHLRQRNVWSRPKTIYRYRRDVLYQWLLSIILAVILVYAAYRSGNYPM